MGCKIKFENCYTPDFEKVWSKCKKRRLSSRKEMGFEVYTQMVEQGTQAKTRIEQLEQDKKVLAEALKKIAKRRSCHDCDFRYSNNFNGYCTYEKEGCVGNWGYFKSRYEWQEIASEALAKIGGEK